MRPMDAGDLIARAIELCSSFNPARVTLDAHADRRLAAWNVRHGRRDVPAADFCTG